MSRPKVSIPRYGLHKASGRAVCYVNRKAVYLGPYDSPESRKKYAEIIDRLSSGPSTATPSPTPDEPFTVADLCLAFIEREFPRYSRSARGCYLTAIRVLRQLYGETPATDFGPLRFRMMRDAMLHGAKGESLPLEPDGRVAQDRQPWTRDTANAQAMRIRRIFRWGVSWELVPADVLTRLETVRSLSLSEVSKPDPSPRRAVPQADIDAVRAVLLPLHRDIFDLLLFTGARPGELFGLTGGMIERRPGGAWVAELSSHKTAHKGKRRFLVFNLSAQAILLRHLKADPQARLFPGRRDNFGHLIQRACKRAGVTPFVPHQLRHTAATRAVDAVGEQKAQRLLGHSDAAMTEHYSRAAERGAIEAAQALG